MRVSTEAAHLPLIQSSFWHQNASEFSLLLQKKKGKAASFFAVLTLFINQAAHDVALGLGSCHRGKHLPKYINQGSLEEQKLDKE